jgi:hypothetical protein
MITISSTDTAKIYFQGSDVEISSIEARLEFTAPMDGKTIQVALSPYSIGGYVSGDEIISIKGIPGFTLGAVTYDLSNGDEDPETWKPQTVQVAHDEVKAYFDGLGYEATISGI